MALGAGNDSFVWNTGDGADDVRGDTETDTVTVNGSTGADVITASPSAVLGHVLVSGGLDVATTENLVVNGLGGGDTLSARQPGRPGPADLGWRRGGDILNGGNGSDTFDRRDGCRHASTATSDVDSRS